MQSYKSDIEYTEVRKKLKSAIRSRSGTLFKPPSIVRKVAFHDSIARYEFNIAVVEGSYNQERKLMADIVVLDKIPNTDMRLLTQQYLSKHLGHPVTLEI